MSFVSHAVSNEPSARPVRPEGLRAHYVCMWPASLRADLLNAQQRATRLAARVHQLESRLSSLLGEHAWQESGLGAPADIDTLKQHNLALEQQIIDLRLQLSERDQDLAAARAANRELMTQINTTARRE